MKKQTDKAPRVIWTRRRIAGQQTWTFEIAGTGFCDLPEITKRPRCARPYEVEFLNVVGGDYRMRSRTFKTFTEAKTFAFKMARLYVLDWLEGSRRALEALA